VRRLGLVAEPRGGEPDRDKRELDAVHRWLSTLPVDRLARHERLLDVPLDETDVLWARGRLELDTRLLAWLEQGGRLLATQDGALLPAALGLECAPPGTVELEDPPPDDFGLAGFGAHPLFTGLRDGAILGPAWGAGAPLLCCYDGVRPAEGAVVAVERRGLTLHAERILAWEYAVGAGGVLCLAFHPSLIATESVPAREAAVLLANALVGEAVPHRHRATATLWPPPGRRTILRTGDDQALRVPADAWPPSSTPALDLTPAAAWTHAGRRLLISARPATGTREVWAPPFRVMHAAAVRDAIPCAPEHIAADEVAGGLALGGQRLLERWVAAPDVAVGVWEIGGPDGVSLVAEWALDLRRAWPYPAGSYGELSYSISADSRSLRVEAAAGPRALFAVTGGTVSVAEVTSPDGPAVRVSCAATTPLRIVVAAGVDQDELERSLRVLARDGVGGLSAARARKATQLRRYGTAFEAPDERLGQGFDWARQRGDEALVGAPGVGRSLLATCPRGAGDDAWCFGAQACAAAAAQLVAGNRDPARELLKFLAQAQRSDGGIGACDPLGGLSAAADPVSTEAFLELAERFLAWTGDVDALRRLRVPLQDALAYLAGQGSRVFAPRERVLAALEDVVDGAGSAAVIAALRSRGPGASKPVAVEAHAVLEAAAAALRRDPGALPGTGAAPALLEAVAALWALEPDAPNAALALAPLVPPGWSGFALRRLRIGRTLLDLEVRRRAGALVLRVAHRFGPRLVLTAGVRGAEVEATEVDDVMLPGVRARFESHDRHEVRFLLRG
jgi:hypothetical protein